jgi:hypothetical protein
MNSVYNIRRMSLWTGIGQETSMSRAEDAVLALYEDASLRDDLVDDDAETLYRWAEAQIARLDAAFADDAAFEQAVAALRRVLSGVNHLVGGRAFKTADEIDAEIAQIAASAAEIGRAVDPEQAPDLARAEEAAFGDDALRSLSIGGSDPSSDSAALAALLAWLDGGAETRAGDPPSNH